MTLTTGNIKSAFRRCGMVPFRPAQVLQMIPEPEPESESRFEPALPVLSALPALSMEWEPPRTHQET